MSTHARSPLAEAALTLLADGATPAELDARFEAAGARLSPGVAERLADELAELGLARRAQSSDAGTRFVRTSLGDDAVAGGLLGPAGDHLAALERLRTDLLATIAHELRTPLTVLRTSVGLLADPSTRPTLEQQRTLIESIGRNAERMQRLVGDILDLSRFRSGTVGLQLRRFDAAVMARSAIAAVAPIAERGGQRIELDEPQTPVHVYGDHGRLEQALLNLVSNAQRFSPDRGTIRVRVELRPHDVAWVVADDGRGIPVDDQRRLFERFFVGRNDRNGAREGVGLGLPTALAIAQAHGGTIEVDSAPGAGSRFALVVPTAGPPGSD